MELRQLEHFVAAAEEGHFTRAADRAKTVQSGLSASIRSLERELGTRLWTRTTRRVELTRVGTGTADRGAARPGRGRSGARGRGGGGGPAAPDFVARDHAVAA